MTVGLVTIISIEGGRCNWLLDLCGRTVGSEPPLYSALYLSAGPNYSAALEGAPVAALALSASLTTCNVLRILEGLMLMELMPSWAR